MLDYSPSDVYDIMEDFIIGVDPYCDKYCALRKTFYEVIHSFRYGYDDNGQFIGGFVHGSPTSDPVYSTHSLKNILTLTDDSDLRVALEGCHTMANIADNALRNLNILFDALVVGGHGRNVAHTEGNNTIEKVLWHADNLYPGFREISDYCVMRNYDYYDNISENYISAGCQWWVGESVEDCANRVWVKMHWSDCAGNFDGDYDVDGNDMNKFMEDFGRNQFNKPCRQSWSGPDTGDDDNDGVLNNVDNCPETWKPC